MLLFDGALTRAQEGVDVCSSRILQSNTHHKTVTKIHLPPTGRREMSMGLYHPSLPNTPRLGVLSTTWQILNKQATGCHRRHLGNPANSAWLMFTAHMIRLKATVSTHFATNDYMTWISTQNQKTTTRQSIGTEMLTVRKPNRKCDL